MIIQEQISDTLVKSYSDSGVYIHGGFPEADYAEVVDPININRTYVETDRPIEDEEIPDSEALNILMGREIHEPESSDDVPEED